MSAAALERFKRAQDSPHEGFEDALAEIRAGAKRGHWIWYVFPQLAGLGTSAMSESYAISDPAEAESYLRDAVLCSRLLTISQALVGHLEDGLSLRQSMGSAIDVEKLVSSMTLFGAIAARLAGEGVAGCAPLQAAAATIVECAATEGFPSCSFTRRRLTRP